MVRLFCRYVPVPVQVPVPFKTILVVPEMLLLLDTARLPPALMVLPVKISGLVPPRVNPPDKFKLLEKVYVGLAPENVTLFQVIPLVFNVAPAPVNVKVDPVTMTVPAVYVNVAVLNVNVPDTVIVPEVFIFVFSEITPVEFIVPVPVNAKVVVPVIVATLVKLPLRFKLKAPLKVTIALVAPAVITLAVYKLLVRVTTALTLVNEILFQALVVVPIPLVFKVGLPTIFNVEPAVITVPAV